MTDYDYWLLSWPGGPEDPAQDEHDEHEEAIERAQDDFRRLPLRARFKARRMAKRSTDRRRRVPAWRARQRREDINAQVLF